MLFVFLPTLLKVLKENDGCQSWFHKISIYALKSILIFTANNSIRTHQNWPKIAFFLKKKQFWVFSLGWLWFCPVLKFYFFLSISDVSLLWELWRDNQSYINMITDEKWASQRAEIFPPNLVRAGHRTESIEKRGVFLLQSGPFWGSVHLPEAFIISSFPSYRFRRAIDLVCFLKKIYPWKILFKIKFRHFTLCCIFPLPLAIILGTHKVNVTIILCFLRSLTHTLSFSVTHF